MVRVAGGKHRWHNESALFMETHEISEANCHFQVKSAGVLDELDNRERKLQEAYVRRNMLPENS